MALTSKSFKGEEQRQKFQPDDQYGSGGDSTEALLKQLAGTQNDPAAHGDNNSVGGVGSGVEGAPRRHGAAQPVPAGNEASTGAQGPFPKGASNMPGPTTTGAGQGSKTVKRYGK